MASQMKILSFTEGREFNDNSSAWKPVYMRHDRWGCCCRHRLSGWALGGGKICATMKLFLSFFILIMPPHEFPFFYVQILSQQSWSRFCFISYVFLRLEWWDAVLQKRLAWALFVLLLSTLVCCQSTELIWVILFQKLSNFTPPPPSQPKTVSGNEIMIEAISRYAFATSTLEAILRGAGPIAVETGVPLSPGGGGGHWGGY